jgi:ornithine cyclodeaminase/alanine dehydrogenase-like protein (mu-crystallin family)
MKETLLDQVLGKILRIHPEPCEYVPELAVHEALTAKPFEYLTFLESRIEDIAQGRAILELPRKQIFTDADGDFRVMPCIYRQGPKTLKVVKIIGTNLVQSDVPDQVTVGRALRLHPKENYVTHIFEACLLSSARTGAVAALATKKLAASRQRIRIVGAGRVGYYAGLYLAQLPSVEEITFSDSKPERAEAVAQALGKAQPNGVKFRAKGSSRPKSEEVLILATTSDKPLFGEMDTDASLVVSVGADTETQRELDSSWPRVSKVYVDTLDSAKVGDIRAWLAEGAIRETELTDFVTFFHEGTGTFPVGRRVFVSSGSALFDNLSIGYFLESTRT